VGGSAAIQRPRDVPVVFLKAGDHQSAGDGRGGAEKNCAFRARPNQENHMNYTDRPTFYSLSVDKHPGEGAILQL